MLQLVAVKHQITVMERVVLETISVHKSVHQDSIQYDTEKYESIMFRRLVEDLSASLHGLCVWSVSKSQSIHIFSLHVHTFSLHTITRETSRMLGPRTRLQTTAEAGFGQETDTCGKAKGGENNQHA